MRQCRVVVMALGCVSLPGRCCWGFCEAIVVAVICLLPGVSVAERISVVQSFVGQPTGAAGYARVAAHVELRAAGSVP